MVQTIPATKITLYDLEQKFQLAQAPSTSFFEEWQTALPALTEAEKQRLARIQATVANLERRSFLENTVKLAVVAPLLDLSGLFLPPFYISTEDFVNIEAADDSLVVQGRIDVLVIKEALWLLVIESKRAEFSPKVGIPQALSYMLASPQSKSSTAIPTYGLVTNGTSFVFLKLMFQEVPRYGRSRQFILDQDNDLEQVLKILKHLAEVVGKLSIE